MGADEHEFVTSLTLGKGNRREHVAGPTRINYTMLYLLIRIEKLYKKNEHRRIGSALNKHINLFI